MLCARYGVGAVAPNDDHLRGKLPRRSGGPPPLTFTLDIEDHRPAERAWPERFTANTHRILDWADEHDVRGTVFVVGSLAETNPGLIREVARRGHEVALHHWVHVPLTEISPEEMRQGAAKGKEVLEEIVGEEVKGYRAPMASMVPDTVWAAEVLSDLGYSYSSSVIPARNPLYGFEGLPGHPFRWPSGLAEFPLHVGGVGPAQVPYVCGTYLRVLPWPVIEWLSRNQPWFAGASSYIHPYDVDEGEPFHWLEIGGWMSPLVWFNRSSTLERLTRLFANGSAGPLREQLDLADEGGPLSPANLRAAISGGRATVS